MFIDADVLVAARFITAPARVAACRCLDRAGDNEEPMRIGRRIVRDRLVVATRSQPRSNGRMVEWSKPLVMNDALMDAMRLIAQLEPAVPLEPE